MPKDSNKRHIGYAIFESGWRMLMTEHSVYVKDKGWARASQLVCGDRVNMSTGWDEIVGFSDVEEVMTQ